MAKYTKQEVADALEALKARLKPGSTVYTSVSQVSQSGMSRHIHCYIVDGAEINNITYWVARVCGDRISPKSGGLVISGCGMDMGFAVVYNLSRVLFQEGFDCAGESCPSNDHHNPPYPPRSTFKETQMRHSGDGGYALHQRWL